MSNPTSRFSFTRLSRRSRGEAGTDQRALQLLATNDSALLTNEEVSRVEHDEGGDNDDETDDDGTLRQSEGSTYERIGLGLPLRDPDGATVEYEHRTIATPLLEVDTDLACSIVAVHGLFGDRKKTWTHKRSGVFWLQEDAFWTENQLAKARVLSYGYDTGTFGRGQGNMTEAAASLLMDLNNLRRKTNTQTNPIVFLAHSLGGLIVKMVCYRRPVFCVLVLTCRAGHQSGPLWGGNVRLHWKLYQGNCLPCYTT